MPPSEPRVSHSHPEPMYDGLHPAEAAPETPDPRDLTDDEREGSWLHTGGFEVG